jgi:hypothetical protein
VKAGKPPPWETVRTALHGRLLERTEDSGPWPCNYDMERPVIKSKRDVNNTKVESPEPPAGVLIGLANLKPVEIQDPADQIGEISSVAIGYDLEIQARIEIESAGNRPRDDVVAKLNAKLAGVSKDLKIGEANAQIQLFSK